MISFIHTLPFIALIFGVLCLIAGIIESKFMARSVVRRGVNTLGKWCDKGLLCGINARYWFCSAEILQQNKKPVLVPRILFVRRPVDTAELRPQLKFHSWLESSHNIESRQLLTMNNLQKWYENGCPVRWEYEQKS